MKDLDEARSDLLARGYLDTSTVPNLTPGLRVRHVGEQWPAAFRDGTAVVLAVMEKDPSSWARRYRRRDVEVIVQRDKPVLEGGPLVGLWADYHCVVLTNWLGDTRG